MRWPHNGDAASCALPVQVKDFPDSPPKNEHIEDENDLKEGSLPGSEEEKFKHAANYHTEKLGHKWKRKSSKNLIK